MNPLDFALLTDENIHPEVVAFLRQQGVDVLDVKEASLTGQADLELLHLAHQAQRVVLTHDSDFGTLAVTQREPFTGILYVRPGHIRAEFTIQTLEAIRAQQIAVQPPFIVVAERSRQTVRIRIKQL